VREVKCAREACEENRKLTSSFVVSDLAARKFRGEVRKYDQIMVQKMVTLRIAHA
jgi:hypothetical protein